MQLSVWADDAIAPASMYIICTALRYNKPNKPEKYPIYYVSLIKLEL